MPKPDTVPKIKTLGCFSISVNGKSVATDWPDETVRELFCSLLSPLDLYITWDRICRSMWGVPESRSSRRRMEETFIRPLNAFLSRELGFKPLITGPEGIRIDREHIRLDALEFHNSAIEGLSLLSRGDHAAAREKFSRAKALYAGEYLPGIPGKIITNTRKDLEALYRAAVMNALPLTRRSGCSGRNRRVESVMHLKTANRSADEFDYGHEESVFEGYRVF